MITGKARRENVAWTRSQEIIFTSPLDCIFHLVLAEQLGKHWPSPVRTGPLPQWLTAWRGEVGHQQSNQHLTRETMVAAQQGQVCH